MVLVNKVISVQESALQHQAILLTNEIFRLIDQYTIDSNISKFFLTDEIALSCFGLAGSFVSPCFTPSLKPTEIKNTQLLSFYYSLMTYGFNLYLKERSLTTYAVPYSFVTDKRTVKKLRKKLLGKISQGYVQSTPLADEVISMLIGSIKTNINFSEFIIDNHKILKKKIFDYIKLSVYWGYNFAQVVIVEKQRVYS